MQVLRLREDDKQEDAFKLSADEFVEDAVQQHELLGFTEIHCVNGENPHVDIEYYAALLRKLKSRSPTSISSSIRPPRSTTSRSSRAAPTRRSYGR